MNMDIACVATVTCTSTPFEDVGSSSSFVAMSVDIHRTYWNMTHEKKVCSYTHTLFFFEGMRVKENE